MLTLVVFECDLWEDETREEKAYIEENKENANEQFICDVAQIEWCGA